MKSYRIFCALFVLAVIAGYTPVAKAAITAQEIQPLKFGDLIITGAPPQRLRIDPDGTETPLDAGITKLSPKGQAGIMKLSGFAPASNVTVTLSSPEVTQAQKSGGSTMDITDFTFDSVPGTYVADASGEILVKVGATMTTNTAAADYSDGAYRGLYTLDLLVDY